MAFIRKPAWIMKSVRGIEFTQTPQAIPNSKRGILFFEEDQEKPIDRDVMVR
jgi:hypothetical protein